MKRCYCGHSGGSFAGCGSTLKSASHISRLQPPEQPRQRTDLLSLTSSSHQSVKPTQFIKRSNNNQGQSLGLGHSSTRLSRDFSRRNSATTTVSHCSSCCSSGYAPQLQRESRVKVLSWANGEASSNHSNNVNNTHCEHTDNRRIYEQRACAASRLTAAEGQGQVHVQSSCNSSATSSPLPPSCSPHGNDNNNELQHLLSLQHFRLLNASDCFSTQRQDELRLQRAYDKLGVASDSKWQKNRANESRQQPATTATTTPYALRQKLLQLRLQQEQAAGRGTGAACAPLERSCALRFNCQ